MSLSMGMGLPAQARAVRTAVLVSSQDSFINAGLPDTNYNAFTSLELNGAPDFFAIYLGFDLSSLAGKKILKAELRLYLKSAYSGSNMTSAIKYIKQAWNEATITYNTRPTIDATTYDLHAHVAGAIGASTVWNITALLQLIADGTIADYQGLCVDPTVASGDYVSYDARSVTATQPKLFVSYCNK